MESEPSDLSGSKTSSQEPLCLIPPNASFSCQKSFQNTENKKQMQTPPPWNYVPSIILILTDAESGRMRGDGLSRVGKELSKSGYGNEDPRKGAETRSPGSVHAADDVCVGNKKTWYKVCERNRPQALTLLGDEFTTQETEVERLWIEGC